MPKQKLLAKRVKEFLERLQKWAENETRPFWRQLASLVQVIHDTVQLVLSSNTMRSAASLSFTTILSLIPLLTVSFAALRAFVPSDDLVEQVHKWVLETVLASSATQIGEVIDLFLKNAQGSAIGAIGFAFLLVSSISLFLSIEKEINQIWRVPASRPLYQRLTTFYAVITLAPALIALGFLSARWLTAHLASTFIPAHYGAAIMPWITEIAAFSLLYKIMPHTRVRWKAAIIGGFAATVAFQTCQWGFNLYIKSFFSGSAKAIIYGSFSVIPIFCLWVQLVWILILCGVSITSTLHRRSIAAYDFGQDLEQSHELTTLNGDLTCQVFFEIARQFRQIGGPTNPNQVAQQLKLNPEQIAPTLQLLYQSGLILITQDENSELAFAPSKALSRTQLSEIYNLFDQHAPHTVLRNQEPAGQMLTQLMQQGHQAQDQILEVDFEQLFQQAPEQFPAETAPQSEEIHNVSEELDANSSEPASQPPAEPSSDLPPA